MIHNNNIGCHTKVSFDEINIGIPTTKEAKPSVIMAIAGGYFFAIGLYIKGLKPNNKNITKHKITFILKKILLLISK